MVQFRVFLGAPSRAETQKTPGSYQWQTISHPTSSPSTSMIFPPATLAAADRRISLIYQNIIFKDAEEDDEEKQDSDDPNGVSRREYYQRQDQTTLITWPPTAEEATTASNQEHRVSILPSISVSRLLDTQETQETASYNYSDASFIGRFPSFNFSLHSLTSLSTLTAAPKSSRKFAVLVAALEVEGPDTITIKKGPDAGKQVSLLKMILGDEEGTVCKLTAWRQIAELWGGNDDLPAVKRGDILFIENVTASSEPMTSVSLTASPYLKSRLDICYRTMPYTHEDKRLRPDLRLGFSDAAVRKVSAVVKWFEGMAGLAPD